MSKKRRFLDDDGEDPTSGIINMTDCMLVLAVGFLVFAIMAVHGNPTLMESGSAPSSTVSVSTGSVVNDTPENGSGSGSGYNKMGTVYKDPTTGKLIMVS